MLRAEAATTVCSRLMDPDPTGQLLFRSVDILWNMLENGDQGQLAEQLNNLTCIRYCVRPKKKKCISSGTPAVGQMLSHQF